ncbi:MAG: hypothetical protein CVV41_04405 [Candidatus Riflebacteria bacterium HGW-Riflebacteria-1]|jgi:HAMP domain-containing protein|nr:MAG: hypothetical protein CVV41_04405 [Candidatus Riflebacteria bacterium HGW-Riflebacteria-1]
MRNFFAKLTTLLKQHLNQRFRVLNLLLGILCFFILPGLIILRGIDGVIALEAAARKQQADQKLQEMLDQLEFFSENDRFAHFLLHSLCSESNEAGNNAQKLHAGIKKLKAGFPDSFTFVVADQQGNLLPDLSDERNFSYLFRQAFKLIDEVRASFAQGNAAATVPEFDSRISRLRPLLGQILRAEDVLLPMRASRTGRSILVSGSASKFHLWYGVSGQFQLIVFINRSFIRSSSGLRWACNLLNRQNPDIVTGFTEYPPDSTSLVPPLSEELTAKTILAIASNEEMHNAAEATDKSGQIVACRFLNQYWRGFALFRQTGLTDPAAIKAVVTASALKFLLVLFFVLFVYHLKNPFSITVKLKIAAFFAYAIILPLLVVASLTMQYVSQSEAEMLDNLKNEAYRAIEKLDAHYDWFLKRRADRLIKYLADEVETHPKIFLDRDSLVKLNDDLKKVANPGEVLITDSSSKDYLLGISSRISRDRSLMSQAGGNILNIIISGNLTRAAENTAFLALLLHSDIYEIQNKISYLGIGDYEMSIFYRLLQPRNSDISKLKLVVVSWELHRLQREHVEDYCRTELALANNLQIAAFCRISEELFMSPQANHQQLVRLMNMSVNRQITQVANVRADGRNYIAVAMPGRKLNKLILAALLPTDAILKHREMIVGKARLFAILLCLLAMATMYLLQSWIFRPLEELKAGIAAIAGRNFHKRLDLICQNEFGKLMAAFNHSLETLQELEVARIVQESILPETSLSLNRCEIAAQTRTMTNLGGDYFDMIPLDDGKVLVFIGDATGHGIPAALSMAMAKAILIHENFRGLHDQKLMQQINAVFGKLRSQGSKDFMTALCVELDTNTGFGRIINAGHCYPMLLKKAIGKTEILANVKGLPPGFDRKSVFTPAEFKLEPGDSLVIYTDGFVECVNEHGRQIGFTGLADLITATADDDAACHVSRIFAKLEQWSVKSQDDCTLVMVRFL